MEDSPEEKPSELEIYSMNKAAVFKDIFSTYTKEDIELRFKYVYGPIIRKIMNEETTNDN